MSAGSWFRIVMQVVLVVVLRVGVVVLVVVMAIYDCSVMQRCPTQMINQFCKQINKQTSQKKRLSNSPSIIHRHALAVRPPKCCRFARHWIYPPWTVVPVAESVPVTSLSFYSRGNASSSGRWDCACVSCASGIWGTRIAVRRRTHISDGVWVAQASNTSGDIEGRGSSAAQIGRRIFCSSCRQCLTHT